jgi:ribosomal protein L7Ae-like RNA K-turn-binding protein
VTTLWDEVYSARSIIYKSAATNKKNNSFNGQREYRHNHALDVAVGRLLAKLVKLQSQAQTKRLAFGVDACKNKIDSQKVKAVFLASDLEKKYFDDMANQIEKLGSRNGSPVLACCCYSRSKLGTICFQQDDLSAVGILNYTDAEIEFGRVSILSKRHHHSMQRFDGKNKAKKIQEKTGKRRSLSYHDIGDPEENDEDESRNSDLDDNLWDDVFCLDD